MQPLYAEATLLADADSLQAESMQKIGRRIAGLRRSRGLNQIQFASEIGVGQSTVSRWESDKQAPEFPHLRAIAQWAGISLDTLTEGTDAATSPAAGIAVVGHVQAGDWQEAVEWPQDERYTVGFPFDERYPDARQFGLVVRGDSMDREYPAGSIVVCASLFDLDREPEPGERVVVYRRSPEGLIEATIKEFQKDKEGRTWLWPRSTRPEYQQPLELDGAEEVEVVAVVIAAFRRE